MQIQIPSLLRSKKFCAAALASILSYFGIHQGMTVEQVGLVTAPLYAYIIGQAAADFGKERAEIDAVFKRAPVTNVHNLATGGYIPPATDDAFIDVIRRNAVQIARFMNSDRDGNPKETEASQ